MANILQPLNTQSPMSSFHQSVSALGAYEQLRGMRRQRHEDTRRDVIRSLLGKASFGDKYALNNLKVTSPQDYYKLLETQRSDQVGQLEAQHKEQAYDRMSIARRLRGAQMAFANLEKVHPSNKQVAYDMIRSRLETDGIFEPGTLADEYTPEVAEDVRLQMQITHDLFADPIAYRELGQDAKLIANAVGGPNTPEFRELSKQLLTKKGIGKLVESKVGRTSDLPPGISLLPDVTTPLGREDKKEVKKISKDGIGVLMELKDLADFVSTVGRQFEWSQRGLGSTKEGRLARQKIGFIQERMRKSLGMGTLDNGAITQLSKMIPDNPTGIIQHDAAVAMIQEATRSFQRGLAQNLRNYNTQVDVGRLTNGYLQGTSDQFLEYRPMTDALSGTQRTLRGIGGNALATISSEISKTREAMGGNLTPEQERALRIGIAAKYGYVYDNGKYFRVDTQDKDGGGGARQGQPPIIGGSPRAQTTDDGDVPTLARGRVPSLPPIETSQARMKYQAELDALAESGDPAKRYLSEENPLPPGPDEPEAQQRYFSNMYAQGHDRELVMRHYMGVWGADGTGAIGRGRNKRPDLNVAPLPRKLYKKEKDESDKWLAAIREAQRKLGLAEESQREYLETQRGEFAVSEEAQRSRNPPRLTRAQRRRLAIKRRQERARRAYDRKLNRVENRLDRVNDILTPVMP